MTDHMNSTEIRALAYLRVSYSVWLRVGDPIDRHDVRLLTWVLTGLSTPRFTYQR